MTMLSKNTLDQCYGENILRQKKIAAKKCSENFNIGLPTCIYSSRRSEIKIGLHTCTVNRSYFATLFAYFLSLYILNMHFEVGI